MKRHHSRLAFVIPVVAALLSGCRTNPGDADATSRETRVNLAVVASPSASYVSGDTSLTALNDDNSPTDSRRRGPGSYGNWPRQGTQWVQYEWSLPIRTRQVEVYWWDDNQGVRLPSGCRLLYWDGDAFVPVPNGDGFGVLGDRFNRTTFDEIETTRLRLEMDGAAQFSTGLLDWKVLDSGRSPDFPPRVNAGPDRSMILGGQTYLSGEIHALRPGASTNARWSRRSGPGKVTFADPRSTTTTATFSAPGDYVLELTAGRGRLSASSLVRVRVAPPPPPHRLDVVHTAPYRVDSPLWNSRVRALIVNWIPHCIDQIENPNLTQGQGGIDNFDEAAKALRGEPHGPHKGYVFANAWVHQTVESMCLALMIDAQGDPAILAAQDRMRATLENWIPRILAAQERDGYLQTAYTLADRTRWPERWSPSHRADHEGYVAGYFIESAINHYMLTQGRDRRLYEGARKLADCWVANIGPGRKEWWDGHQEMEQALVRFGRFVNDIEGSGAGDTYVALARFLLDCRKGGDEYDQSHLPVTQQYEAVGHAVRAVYSYSAMADVAAETGDVDYQSAVLSLWDNIVHRKYYLTGGIGSGETSEGFGPDYSLRNEAYCESCSSCGLIFFQHKLNLAYHDARYADLYEETLYNALLGSIDLQGRNFYYTNPLIDPRPRHPWHACPCCVGNIPRTLLMIPAWAYVKSPEGVYVNLFIGSKIQVGKVAGTDLEMVQKTDYPWQHRVSLTVNPKEPRRFTVFIRVPNRQTSSLYTPLPTLNELLSLSVNGIPIQPSIERGYAAITREWTAGDRVDFDVPLAIQRVTADERIEADRGRVALRRGPLIYSVEPEDNADLNQALSPLPLSAEWRGDFLEGVMVIRGTWADGSPMLAIPNYTRNNRIKQPASGAPRREGSRVWMRAE